VNRGSDRGESFQPDTCTRNELTLFRAERETTNSQALSFRLEKQAQRFFSFLAPSLTTIQHGGILRLSAETANNLTIASAILPSSSFRCLTVRQASSGHGRKHPDRRHDRLIG
jgi:hypothetical protein